MNKNSLGFASLLIIIVLAIIGVSAYFVLKPSTISTPSPISTTPSTKTPDYSEETSGWNTYKNHKYGYYIKYPEGSSPTERLEEDQYLSFVVFGKRTNENSMWFEITVREASLSEEVEYIKWQSSHSLVQLTNEEDLPWFGSAKKLDFEPSKYDEPKPTSFIIVSEANYAFTISSSPDNINQIFSTFGFFDVYRTSPLNENLISQIPKFTIPVGLEESQLSGPQKMGDTFYIKFLKSNMNFPVNSTISRSGILAAKERDDAWKIFYEIKELSGHRNNPYHLWKEDGQFYTTIVDTSGAGSGEGTGKLIKISSQKDEWKIIDCFYYAPDSFHAYINNLPANTSLSQGVISYDEPFEGFIKNNGKYIFDESTQSFVINGRVEESCTAFDLDL